MKRNFKDLIPAIVTLIVSILIIIFAAIIVDEYKKYKKSKEERPEIHHHSAVEMLRKQHQQQAQLTEFDKLIMAIAYTESKFRTDVTDSAGAKGILQIMPCYVAEVNRLYGTDYVSTDAFDLDKSLELFNLMQDYYNPDRNIDEGIRRHNKSSAYKRTVMENYKLICRMEELRSKLIQSQL